MAYIRSTFALRDPNGFGWALCAHANLDPKVVQDAMMHTPCALQEAFECLAELSFRVQLYKKLLPKVKEEQRQVLHDVLCCLEPRSQQRLMQNVSHLGLRFWEDVVHTILTS